MMEALEPTHDPDWVLTHEGYCPASVGSRQGTDA